MNTGRLRLAIRYSRSFATLGEHPQIECEWRGIAKSDCGEIRMRRIQQNIPFATDGRGGDEQGWGSASTNPSVPEAAQRLVSRLPPGRRKRLRLNLANLQLIGNLAFDSDQIRRSQFRFQIDKGLDGGEGQ